MSSSARLPILVLAALFGAAPGLVSAQATGPIASERLLVEGARLSIAPGDESQTLNVAEPATVRTCFGGVCGAMAAGDPRVAGLLVEAELSGPEVPQPVTYSSVPGGAFVLPGFQAEGTYLLSNVRLVRAGTGQGGSGDEVLGSATPAVAVIEVRRILLTSATVRQLTLEELQARGITLSQESFQAFGFSVGFAFADTPVTIDFPVLFQEGGQAGLLSKPQVNLDGLPADVAAAVARWQPPTLVPFQLEAEAKDGLYPSPEEAIEPQTRLFGVIVLPGNVSYLNQFFDAQLLVANGAQTGSGAVLTNVTASVKLPPGVPREVLRLARTTPPVSPGQKVPVLGATGSASLGPGEPGTASFTLEGLVPGTHVLTMEVGAELERPGREALPLAGKLKTAVEVVDARFNLTFNHPDVVREGEAYTLYVTVTNLSRAEQNLITVELLDSLMTGAHRANPTDDFSPTIETLAPGAAETVEFRLVADVTGRCVATTFQSDAPVEGKILLRAGVGESGIPLSPSSLVLPRFTEQLPEPLVRANARLLGLAYSLAVAPPGSIPPGLPRVVKSDVERRAVDLAEAGQRTWLGDDPLASYEALLLDQLGNRHDLPEYDQLRRTLAKGRDAAEALASLVRAEQSTKGLSSGDLLTHLASTVGYARPFLAATIETSGTGVLPTLEVRKQNGGTGVTFLARSGSAADALRSLPFGEVYDVLDRASGTDLVPLAVVGRLAPQAAYVVALHGPSAPDAASVALSMVLPAPGGAGLVSVELSGLQVPAGEAWAVEAVRAEGDARPLTFQLVHLATGLPVAGAPPPVVRAVDLPPFRLVGARQDFVLDPYGSGVWYLFNRPPDRTSAGDESRYSVETRFRGHDTTSSGQVLDRTVTFGAESALWQPTSERVVAVRYAMPVSAIRSEISGQPVVTNLHHLDSASIRDAFGNALEATVPEIAVESGHVGGLVEGRVVRGTGDAVAGAAVHLVRTRVIQTDFEPIVLHDRVATATTGADGSYFFPFVEEPVLPVPRPREMGSVQGGFRVRAVVPPGPDPLAPEEKEEVSSFIRLQSRLARIDIALLGRGSVMGSVLYEDGVPVAGAAVTGASTLFSEVRTATAGTDGAFRVDALPVGPVTVSARDREGRSAHATVGLAGPGDVKSLTLRIPRGQLPRTGTVVGTVLLRRQGATGPVTEPASGARVAAYSDGVARDAVTVGSTGTFRFEAVPEGRVTVQAADFTVSRTPALADVDLPAGQTAEVTLTLAASATRAVTGRVLFHDPLANADVPVAGATVFVPGPGSFAYTEADGTYRIEDVPSQGVGESYSVEAIDFARKLQGRATIAVTDASPDPVVAATIVLASASGAVEGVVLDPLGRPAPGVMVTLVPYGEMLSRADGTFAFEDVAVGRHRPVAHVGDGLSLGSTGWIGDADAEVLFGRHRAFTTIRLRGAGTLHVRTRTANGGVKSPLSYRPTWYSPSAMSIGLRPQAIETSTDDDGRLTLTVPVGEFVVTASNPFHGTKSASGRIDFAGQTKEADLLLESSATVTGHVVDVDGVTPVAGIAVELSAQGLLPQRISTDALGGFRFELVPPGNVSVTAKGLRGAVERVGQTLGLVTGPGQELDLFVRLKAQGTVRGRVVEETSPGVRVPLANAQVVLFESDFPLRRLPAEPGFLVAGSDGRFEVAGVTAGRFSVLARDPGQVSRQGRASGEVRSDFEVLDVGDVVLSTLAGTLGVLVRDPVDGSPVPAAQVTLSTGEATVAGADGRVTFDALPLGSYDVHAFHAPSGRGGRATGVRLLAAGDSVEAVVVLDQRGRVAGTLFDDAAMTVAVPGGVVRLQGTVNGRLWGAGVTALATTSREAGAEGAFAFDGLPVGSYALAAAVEGSPRRAAEDVSLTPTAPEASVALVLEPVRDLFVRLFHRVQASPSPVEVNPDPATGDGVFAVTFSQEGLGEVNRLAPDVPYPAHSYRFDGVLAARGFGLRVQEASGEMRRGSVSSSQLAAGGLGSGTQADPYRLVLLGRGTVRVTVRDGGGGLVAGARVRIAARNGSVESATDATGRAGFAAVEEGAVTVSAFVPGGLGASVQRTLTYDDEVLDVDLSLAPAVGAHGVVYLPPEGDAWDGDVASLSPAAGVAVRIRPQGGAEQLVLTEADGAYAFQGLPSGAYSIEALTLDGALRASAAGSLGSAHGTDYALLPLVLDASRPAIVSLTPPSGQTLVSRAAPVTIVFSERLADAVLPSGPTSPFFSVTWPGGPASGSWSSAVDSLGRQVVRFTPSPRYENLTTYTLLVRGGPGGVRDREGRPLTDAGDVGSSFTTSDTDGPVVVGTVPSLDRPVDPEAQIRIDFSEPLALSAPQLAASVAFEWQGAGGAFLAFPVTVSLTRGGYSVLLDQPQGVVFTGDTGRRRLSVTGLTDSSGNPMPPWVTEYRLLDANAPVLSIGLPPNAPDGDLANASRYVLTPVLSNLDDLPEGDVDRVEYRFASLSDPTQPAGTPGAVIEAPPYALELVATYSGDGVTPMPFPVWVKAFDTSGNASGEVRLDMRVVPNTAPAVADVAVAAAAPVAGVAYAGSTLAATVSGISDADDARLTLAVELRRVLPGGGSEPVQAAPARSLDRPAEGWQALPPQAFSFTLPLAEPEGTALLVRARVTDGKGAAASRDASLAVADDAGLPAVTDLVASRSTGEAATSFVIGDGLTIELRATDAETAVKTATVATTGGVFPAEVALGRVGASDLFRSGTLTVPASVTEPVTVTVTATAEDHGGNARSATLLLDVAPSADTTLPVAEWLSPFEGGLWPAAYASVDPAKGGVDLLLRVRVTDLDRDGSGHEVPGAFVDVKVRGPVDAAGTLDTAWTSASRLSSGPGEWVYEAVWRVPNGVAAGTSLPFEAEVTDAGANRTTKRVTLGAVPARHVYEGASTAIPSTSDVPAPAGTEGLPVFLLDGTTLSLYPPAAGGARGFASLHLYSGGAWSAGAGSPVSVRRTVLTSPEVTSYGSLVAYYPLELSIAEALAVGHGAAIDVTGRGLLGGDVSHDPVTLPGVSFSAPGAGGSHGGSGHPHLSGAGGPFYPYWLESLSDPGGVYDEIRDPSLPGGGGGRSGAAGGGVVRVDASGATLRLHGEIAADGAPSAIPLGSGGAGGTVRVRAASLLGRGSIHADGSVSTSGVVRAAGGGGRVAISWTEPAGLQVEARAEGGPSSYYDSTPILAGAGTVFLERLAGAVQQPLDRGTLRIANPQSAFPAALTPLPGLGTATVTAVDAVARTIAVAAPDAAGSIQGESVVVTVAPSGSASTTTVLPVTAQTRTALPPAQTFTLTVSATDPDLQAIASALAAGAAVTARARLAFAAFEGAGAARVVSGDELEVAGLVDHRSALALDASARVLLGAEAPVVSFDGSTPAPGTGVAAGTAIDVRFRVTDPLGLSKVEETWSVDGTTKTRTFPEPLGVVESPSPTRLTVPIGQTAPVTYRVRATDRAGRLTEQVATWPIAGDTTPPVIGNVSLSATALTAGDQLYVTFDATDDVGVVSRRVLADGIEVPTWNAGWLWYGPPQSEPTRTATITVEARDAAGNVGSATRTVTVNRLVNAVAPSIAFDCPTSGAILPFGYGQVLRAAASDDQRVHRVEFFRDAETEPFSVVVLNAGTTTNPAQADSASVPTPAGPAPGSVTYRAVAHDFADNTAEATVTVQAVPTVDLDAVGTNDWSALAGSVAVLRSGTLALDQPRTLAGLVVLKGASITQEAGGEGRVDLTVNGPVYLECGATIDVTGKGWPARQSYPGVAPAGASEGGTHIGMGHVQSGSTREAAAFGGLVRPLEAGGGGAGVAGGGVVRLRASRLLLDRPSTVRANGAATQWWGAGAGGSVWLTVDGIDGNGAIEAKGGLASGNAERTQSGGGGAIRLELRQLPARTPAANVSAAAPTGTAGHGTVVVTSPARPLGDLFLGSASGTSGETWLPSLGAGEALTGTAGTTLLTDMPAPIPGWFAGHWVEVLSSTGAFKGRWQVAGVEGTSLLLEAAAGETVSLEAGDRWRGVHRFDAVSASWGGPVVSEDAVRLDGEPATFAVVSGHKLLLHGGLEGGHVELDGQLAARTVSTTSFTLAQSARLYAYRLAAEDLGSLRVETTGSLRLSPGASVDATGLGYPAAQTAPGATAPGPGSGGSHLGIGALKTAPQATSFGSVERPAEAGGGGGTPSYPGGGVLRLVAGSLDLETGSAIRTAGSGSQYGAAGAGAGGSIRITAGTITGDGTIEAPGGSVSTAGGSGGGGGAVAIEVAGTLPVAVSSKLSARGGVGAHAGGPGTILLKGPASTFGDLVVDNGGPAGTTDLPSFGGGVAQEGTSGTTLVTQRASIPSWFAGHWVEVSRGGAPLGTWRVGTVEGSRVTLAPDAASGTAALLPGDAYQGVYRFDSATVRNGATLQSGDPIRDRLPTITVTAPSAGATFSSGASITVAFTTTDDRGVAKVTLTLGSSSVVVPGPNPTTATIKAPWVAADTAIPLVATVTDVAGQSVSRSVPLTVLAPPPLAAVITSPVSGAALYAGEPQTVVVRVVDARPLQRVTLTLGSYTQAFSHVAGRDVALSLAVPAVPADETRALTATVEDTLGGVVTTAPISLRLLADSTPRVSSSADATSPVLPGTAIRVGYSILTRGTSGQARLQVTGSVTHEQTLTLEVVYGARPGAAPQTAARGFIGSFTPFTVPPTAQGPMTIAVTFTDATYGVGTATPIVLAVEPPAGDPTASLSGPASVGPGGELDLQLHAEDDLGLRSARLSVTGAFTYSRLITLGPSGGEVATADRTIRVPVPRDASGAATATVEVSDSDGNATTSEAVTTAVADVTAPRVTRIRSERRAFTAGSTVPLWADATDDGIVTEVRYFVDGALVASASEPLRQRTYETGAPISAEGPTPRDVLVRVEAEDAAGNVGFAEKTFTVFAAGTPLARFRIPTDGAMAVAGKVVPLRVDLDDWSAVASVSYFLEGDPAPFATVTAADGFAADCVVPEGTAPESVLGFRAEATSHLGAVGTATTSVTVVAGDLLGNGQTLEGEDLSHEDRTVIVEGDLLVRGPHRFARLVLLPNASVRHDASESGAVQRLRVDVTGDVYVGGNAGLRVEHLGFEGGLQGTNVSPEGWTIPGLDPAAEGEGGGHGGAGESSTVASTAGLGYDSVRSPDLPGAGGGADEQAAGGPGGGALHLVVGGRLVVDGELNAFGDDGAGGGAGAGGSLRVEAGRLSGSGWLAAPGGTPWPRAGYGGGGGGGRISVRAELDEPLPVLTAAGAVQWFGGGAPGTLFVSSPGDRDGHLVVDTGWAEQVGATELVSIGSGTVTEASGRSFRGAGIPWVPGVEGLAVDVRRDGEYVGRFLVESLDQATQTLTLEAEAEGQIAAGDTFAGVQVFDSVSVQGRARLVVEDALEARPHVDPMAALVAAGTSIPPVDAAPTVRASIPTHDVHPGDTLAVTTFAADDHGLSRLVLWVHGDDASRVEVPIEGEPSTDGRTTEYTLPATLSEGDHDLGIGVFDSAGQGTSTVFVLHVTAAGTPGARPAPASEEWPPARLRSALPPFSWLTLEPPTGAVSGRTKPSGSTAASTP